MTLFDAASGGDRREALEALRDRLAQDLDDCASMRDVAALSQRLMDVLKQIDELGSGAGEDEEETGLSDFERRLRERQSASADSRTAKGG